MEDDIRAREREMEAWLNDEFLKYATGKKRITSAASFAKWLGVSNTSLSQWMNGQRLPSGRNIYKIANKLGPHVYEICGIPPHMPEDKTILTIVKLLFTADDNQKQRVMDILLGKDKETDPVVDPG